MTARVELPVWALVLILLFAAVTFASHFLFPSVRWFLRRRAERVVAELNKRLERPIQPFKLARRTDMIQRVIYDRDVVEAVQARATETGVREDVVFAEAKRYAREIVPSFSATAYFGFATRVAKRLSRFLFDVHFAETRPGSLAAIDPEATVIYVMNHRSNMDYVLVTYLAARRSALSYAVGEWARVWPLTGFIRWMGAFFIRRRSSNGLYRQVLARYVQLSTQAGVPQAMFPEGGLSLSGAPGDPKLGLISYIIEGYSLSGRDMVFVPVAINYDRVLEDRVLVAAGRRGDRRFRASAAEAFMFSLRYLWRRVRGRGHRFGAAAVVAAEPLSLRLMAEADGVPSPEVLARALFDRIRASVPIPLVPLVAHAIRDAADTGAAPDDDAIVAAVGDLVQAIEGQRLFLTFDPAQLDTAVRFELSVLRRRRILAPGPTVAPQGDGPELLAFYARSVAHHLAADSKPAAEGRAPAEFEPT
ncbi:1-acyl-sn-glycerol-3-phosphate acyltransferase [Palleronia sp. KMU-117]|uniref:1-acyl-sn-glycerol-3-phosphate acyltransferase n=1 Tax=Palleronia sp. KMU-117 TaxID=3434108 RepID=UPI003D71F16A